MMKIHIVHSGNFKLDGGAMFGVVPKVLWQKWVPADENNLCNWAMRCLLIKSGDRKILIDTGIGNKQSEKFFGYYYLNGDYSLDHSLSQLGLRSSDITDVLLTHLHFEATEPNPREKASFLSENILPIQESGQLNFIERVNNVSPTPLGFDVLFVDGHTESMMIPHISYMGKTVVFMADLLPSVGHIPLPYVMGYDTRPLLTMTEKELFLNTAADNGYVLFFEHDSVNECCTLQHTEKGVRLLEAGRFVDFF